ncbi:MAG: peroxiredoxin family protein [Candidatus Aminicenantales bacterium]
MKQKKLLFPIFIALVIGNAILIILNIDYLKRKKNLNYFRPSQIVKPDFFNTPCPDIKMVSIQGQKIRLSDLKGDVVLIRFTTFHYLDHPYLHYLEHLYKKFKNEGMKLFFVYSKGRADSELIDEFIPLSIPIIEDDGSIVFKFNSRANDTIIIGRDFKIKFKSNSINNRAIYNQAVRFLYEDEDLQPTYLHPSDRELSSLIKRISYLNIKNSEIENLGMKMHNKPFKK